MADGTSDCEATLRELRTFLDSELGVDARTAVQGHIEGCLDCLQAFDFHAELRQVIARKCCDDLPPGLLAKIRRCLGETDDVDGTGDLTGADDGAPR